MKVLGSELFDFWQKGWPEGYYVDDSELEVEEKGVSLLDPGTKYDIERFGYLIPETDDLPELSLASAFKRWKKQKTTTSLLVEVPRERQEEISALLTGLSLPYKVI